MKHTRSQTLLSTCLEALHVPHTEAFVRRVEEETPWRHTLYGLIRMLAPFGVRTEAVRVARKERLAEYESENKQPAWFDNPQTNTDVFISYSRADEKVAEQLYDKLCKRGLSVWFDRKNLGAGVPFRKEGNTQRHTHLPLLCPRILEPHRRAGGRGACIPLIRMGVGNRA